ncbi:hypothetical protein BKA56DRAFT_669816 [Ilyonectria sp. MPI-CAGE-AT-0026]|nr:hypothetical protein BKA56DRAFT_669816 [Ilyonectria sp. MPI-CAGE-AT-0026]
MALASAAVAAGTVVASMYLDAHFHIKQDVKDIWNRSRAFKKFMTSMQNRGPSIWPFFEDQAVKYPNEQCIWSVDGCYTWKETEIKSRKYAQYLFQQGLKPGDMFAVYLQNSPDFIFAMLAGWVAGCGSAHLNYNLLADSLIHCVKLGKCKLLLVDADEECVERIEAVRSTLEDTLGIRIVILTQAVKDAIDQMEPINIDKARWAGNLTGTPISLVYTSGSTGLPKAVGSNAGKTWALGEHRVRSLGLKTGPKGDRWYVSMPLYHGTGCSTAINCLLTGMTLCIGKKFSVSRFWDEIRASRATAFVYVGETARYLLSAPKKETDRQHGVRMMFGNGLRGDVWEKFSDRFGVEWVVEIFNSTEGVFVLSNRARGPYLTGSVGHHGLIMRMMNKNVYIPVQTDVDSGNIWRDPKTGFAQRKSYEEGGEIIVRVPDEKAFAGYWQNPEATAKKFERNVFQNGDLFYRTGDALRRTADGRWFFSDRLGDTFRWKSENVATTEVAETIGKFPGIVEASVYGVEVPGHEGRAGTAAVYIRPEERGTFDFDALQNYCEHKLPKYAVPVFLRLLNELSPMHNNKQNKMPLKRDGIDVAAISRVAEAEGKVPDLMLWRPAALGNVKGTASLNKFVEFTAEHKAQLEIVSARL